MPAYLPASGSHTALLCVSPGTLISGQGDCADQCHPSAEKATAIVFALSLARQIILNRRAASSSRGSNSTPAPCGPRATRLLPVLPLNSTTPNAGFVQCHPSFDSA